MGQSVVDGFDFWKGRKNSYVMTQADSLAFMQMFFDRVLKIPPKESLPILTQIMKGGSL